MEYVKENIKKQKVVGTVLGMTDEVGTTIINKLIGRENVMLYSDKEYQQLFKMREISNAIEEKDNLVVTADGDKEIEEITQLVGKENVKVFSFTGKENNIQFNYKQLGAKEMLFHAMYVDEENDYILEEGKKAVAKLSTEEEHCCNAETVKLLDKLEKLSKALKAENNSFDIKEYFNGSEAKTIVIDTRDAKQEEVKFLINLLRIVLEGNGITTMIVKENELSTKLVQSDSKIRTIVLCEKESEVKVPEAIELHVNTMYTVVIGDEWLIFKTPAKEEIDS